MKAAVYDEIRPEMLKALNREQRRSSLADSCVSSGVAFWKGTERLAKCRDHAHTQDGNRKECINYWGTEMITIRFAGWISGRIVSLQPDKDIQKLLSNGNRIRIRISETLLSIFRGFRLLQKGAHCTIIHLLSSEAPFQPSAPWLRVCLWCNPVMESRDLFSVSRPVFWNLDLGLEGLRSRLGLEGFRSRSRTLRLETLHRLFFMKFCKKELL